MENQQAGVLPTLWEKNKMLIKGLFIGFMIVVMLIPVAMLMALVNERQKRQQEVTGEISSKWASQQTVSGPVIAVPYIVKTDSAKGTTIRRYAYVLPEQLNINGKLLPEIRHRSIYDVTLYRSFLNISGHFDPAAIQKLNIPAENILWNESTVTLGLDDARGLEEEVKLQWNNTTASLEAGLPDNSIIKTGLSVPVPIDAAQKSSFNINMRLKGSSYLYFTPLGKSTQVTLSSPWKDPAFDGHYLPFQPAKIHDSGFSATWKILEVSRSYPQAWKDMAQFDISQSAFGVKLLQPTDGYAKTERSVKYAILIIALTFTIFFFIEVFQKKQVHPLQYILVGIALCVFYSLLLSISEYTGFNIAYFIATTATVALISLYVLGIFKKIKIATGFATALGGLYAYIFILIQLQDYALLYGSIGLFIILAIIMYYSRRINWYGTAHLSQ